MKIFLSYSFTDKELVEQIRLKIESAGHQVLSADLMINSAEHTKQLLSEMLNKADAYVAIVSPESQKSNWLVWEWQTALELSWENPEKILVGVVVGNIDPPPFLQERQFVRIVDGRQAGSSAERILDFIGANDAPTLMADEVRQMTRKRRDELASEISRFRLSYEDLEKQRQWLLARIEEISEVNPESVDVAKLKMKLADILKRMGKDSEIVPLLQASVKILENNGEIAAPKIAKAQIKLAKALDRIGEHDGAINKICDALNLHGIETDPNQVKLKLKGFKSKLPELSGFLSTTIERAGADAAQKARRLIELIDSAETDPDSHKAGGEP